MPPPTVDLTDVARQAADRIITRGWWQGDWVGPDGEECLHRAVQRCSPKTGDGYLVSAVLDAWGYSTDWQDGLDSDEGREEALRLLRTVEITDADLASTFGPQWRPVVALVRQAARLDGQQTRDLAAARAATGAAARVAAWDATWAAAGDAARNAARNSARSAAKVAAWAWAATGDAAWSAASDAALAVVVADLVGRHGLTQDHIDTLLGPWRQVVGDPLEAA